MPVGVSFLDRDIDLRRRVSESPVFHSVFCMLYMVYFFNMDS
jgi:hypothetical protein